MKNSKTAAARKYVPIDYLDTLKSIDDSIFRERFHSKAGIMQAMKDMMMRSDGGGGIYCPYFDFEGNLTNVKLKRFLLGKDELLMGTSNFVFDISDGYTPSFFDENYIFKSSKKLLPPQSSPLLITIDEFTAIIGSIYYPSFLWLASGSAEITEHHANFIQATGRSCEIIYGKGEYTYAKQCKVFLSDRGIKAKSLSIKQSGFSEQLFFFDKLEG
jgi:hypothetical protein